jgi:hypothetical protein
MTTEAPRFSIAEFIGNDGQVLGDVVVQALTGQQLTADRQRLRLPADK